MKPDSDSIFTMSRPSRMKQQAASLASDRVVAGTRSSSPSFFRAWTCQIMINTVKEILRESNCVFVTMPLHFCTMPLHFCRSIFRFVNELLSVMLLKLNIYLAQWLTLGSGSEVYTQKGTSRSNP